MSPDLVYPMPLRDYIKTLIVQHNGEPVFSKLNILSNVEVLCKIGDTIGESISDSSNGLCILATSGIPVGIVASLYKNKPIYFFHRKGWQRKGVPIYVLPSPPPNLEINLIDSHVRSGLTSRAAYMELTDSYQSRVSTIYAPVIFKPLITHRCDIQYKALSNYQDTLKILSDLLEEPEASVEARLQDVHGTFWSYPPNIQIPLDEFKSKNPLGKLRWFKPTKSPISMVELISEETKDLIHKNIRFSDQGVWELFQASTLVKNICKIAGEKISIDQYDYLVGVQPLGMALAVALAYCNKDLFKGQIVAWLGQAGFIPRITDWENKKVLIVTVRVQVGTYLADVVSQILQQNGKVKEIMMAIPDFDSSTIYNRYRLNALASLKKYGIRLLSLS